MLAELSAAEVTGAVAAIADRNGIHLDLWFGKGTWTARSLASALERAGCSSGDADAYLEVFKTRQRNGEPLTRL
jgi:hypothetical protein